MSMSVNPRSILYAAGLLLIIAANIPSSTASDDDVIGDIGIISEYWGQMRPYANNEPSYFGVSNTGLPEGCQVEQAHVLHRHANRYPTDAGVDYPFITSFVNKVSQVVARSAKFTGPLEFLNTWTTRVTNNLLVPMGAAAAYSSGVDFWNRYGRILFDAPTGQPYYVPNGNTKIRMRTSSVLRVQETTLAWANGFFGPYNTTDKYTLLVIPSTGVTNTTLFPTASCTNGFKTFNYAWSDAFSGPYLPRFLTNALARISAYAPPNTDFTVVDIFSMQLLCTYEYSAVESSDFCSLFTLNEWKGFELVCDNIYYYSVGYGTPTARAQGIGYVQELVARLTNKYITVSHSSINSTLDSSPNTFPLNQSFYFDGSHDTTIVNVLSALSIDYFRENVSLVYPPPSRSNFRISHMTPFAARLITEKIGCISPTPNETNSTRTQYTKSQYKYSAALATNKFIRIRLNDGIIPLDTMRGGLCSVGRTDGMCPLNRFITAQGINEILANYAYTCFGNYSESPAFLVNDGTVF